MVVGSGPAGLFAALVLAETGAKVTIVERGQPVEGRGGQVRLWCAVYWIQRAIFAMERFVLYHLYLHSSRCMLPSPTGYKIRGP